MTDDQPNPDMLLLDTTSLTVFRGGSQFKIKAVHHHIADTPFYATYLHDHLLRQHQPGRHFPHASEFISQRCAALMARLAPNASIRGCTVEELVKARTWHLELVPARDGEGDADDGIEVIGESTLRSAPSYNIHPTPLSSLPSSCSDVPHIAVSSVTIAPTPENAEGRYVSFWLPKGKTLIATGDENETKPRFFRHRHVRTQSYFERELDVLGRILQTGLRGGESGAAGLGSGEVRVARLTEIVTADGKAVGFTTEYISSGFSLFSERAWEDPALARKWEEQVRQTVQALHAKDIVWGTVNPGAVVIDKEGDAWIVDFSGVVNSLFVGSDELGGTKEGDWEGVRVLFESWLPSQRRKGDGSEKK